MKLYAHLTTTTLFTHSPAYANPIAGGGSTSGG